MTALPEDVLNTRNEDMELFLAEKERLLMEKCVRSQFIVSESDVGAKHYALIDAGLEQHPEFIVSTEWTILGKSGKFDLVVVNKWAERYRHLKECYKRNWPYYAVEYKIDDEPGRYGKGHQAKDFKNDVKRLSQHCTYLQRAFALYYYRGPISFGGNVFDKKSPDYLFKNETVPNKDKLNVYFVDRFGIHRLELN